MNIIKGLNIGNSIVNHEIATEGYNALVKRMQDLGRSIDEIDADIPEILNAVLLDASKYHIDYNAYMKHLVVLSSNKIMLNF